MLLCLPIIGCIQLLGVAGMACLQRSCQAHLGQEACPPPSQELGRKSTAYNQLKRKLGTEYTNLSVLRTLTWMCVIPPLVNVRKTTTDTLPIGYRAVFGA